MWLNMIQWEHLMKAEVEREVGKGEITHRLVVKGLACKPIAIAIQ
jgi:hypothetical protein